MEKQDRNFYVCSYGGCASWMLCDFLRKFGTSFHVHSRFPPREISLVKREQFTDQPDTTPAKKFVIFIYSHPSHSIRSRAAFGRVHWRNIGVPDEIAQTIPSTPEEYLALDRDPVGYAEFFLNYTSGGLGYPVYAVNYHRLWRNLRHLLYQLGIPESAIDSFPHERDGVSDSRFTPSKVFCEVDELIHEFPPFAEISPGGSVRVLSSW